VARAEPLQGHINLGGVDELEQVADGRDLDHAEESLGRLVIAGGDGAVDLEMTEQAFDPVALLVEDGVVDDRLSAVRAARDDGIDTAPSQIVADGVSVISLVASRAAGSASDSAISVPYALQSAACPPVRWKASGRPPASAIQ
jgi:hypothetical protein